MRYITRKCWQLLLEEQNAQHGAVVKVARSGLSFSYSLFSFFFSFRFTSLYSIFRTRVRVRVMRSHGHTTGHKPHDKQEDIEGSGRDDVILCAIHGHLG